MELRQMQHFVAAAEEKHFTRAAQRVNIVQSALSASIRALEDELGAKLLIRSTRQVRLTAAGEVFYVKALAALDAVQDAREAVTAVQGLSRGVLSIGTMQSLPAFLDLPSLLARFHADHPGIEIRLSQGGASHLLDKIRAGRLDIAFLPIGEALDDITSTIIACESLVIACAPSHPLAGRRNVPLSSLRDQPFVDFQPDWGTRRLVDQGFSGAGIVRRTAFEVSDLETLLDLVSRGLGIALVPETTAAARGPALAMATLAEPELCWELVAAEATVAHADQNRAARAFMTLLTAAHPVTA